MSTIRKINLVCLALAVLASGLGMASSPVQSATRGGFAVVKAPTVDVLSTIRDTSVTIYGDLFLRYENLDVYLEPFGSNGLNKIKIATVTTDRYGSVQALLTIPSQLKGNDKLDLLVQRRVDKHAIYSWFYNMTSGPYGYSKHPKITILDVVPKKTVNIAIYNTPPHQTFEIFMMSMDYRSVSFPGNGRYVSVGTLNSANGGTFTMIFNIPSKLARSTKIFISMHSSETASFTWFTNWLY